MCSPAFVQDGKAFEDCTTTRSPDGQMNNQEWCYVDAKEKGASNWDYCKPIMDFDKLREKNQLDLDQLATHCRRVKFEISQCIEPGEDSLNKLKKVLDGQAVMDSQVNLLMREMYSMKENLSNLFNIKEQWESEEEKIIEIVRKIDKKVEETKGEKKKNISTPVDPDMETLIKEQNRDQMMINPLIQEKKLSPIKKCEGMLAYEEDNIGDGLNGFYFDNEFFMGEYKEKKSHNIDFDWTGSSPIPGINTSNFSVRWEGFIYAPFSSEYQFSLECDDGASIALNDKMIVSHNMLYGIEESKARVESWLKREIKKKEQPGTNYNKSTSKKIRLTGGNKYKIVISYFHTVHNDIVDIDKVYVQLSWSSDQFQEVIVEKKYLFSENTYSPLKITTSNQVAIVRSLLENDLAFKDSDIYMIKDIPSDYQGLTSLKLNMKHLGNKLDFTINIPSIVYIARPSWFPNPLPTDFENTGEFMTLLQIEKPNPNNVSSQKISSKKSGVMKIFKKKFAQGNISIPLNIESINAKGVSLVVFFGFDSQILSPISCGGAEMNISLPSSPSFMNCEVSSMFNPNYGCKNGLLGKDIDQEGYVWATSGQGVGAWINVQFNALYQINKLVIKNRRNPAERNTEILVTFSGGEERRLTLQSSDGKQYFPVDPPIRAQTVKFTITKVAGTINNGGFFEVYGTKCVDADEIEISPEADPLERAAGTNPGKMKPFFDLEDKKPILLTCKDSLVNSKNLDNIKQKPGNKVIVKCMENCGTYKVPVYGDYKYSKDSAICKSAYHSQKLKEDGGLVEMIFEPGLPSYPSASRNGIKSKRKGKSDITISFVSAEEEDTIIVANGSKVDYKDPKRGWLPASITKIVQTPAGRVLTLIIDGEEGSQNPIEAEYPNKIKILPCGEKTKNRDCRASRNDQAGKKPIKINFAPVTYNKSGDYLYDRGLVFGKSGYPYGWSLVMSNRFRERVGGFKNDLETFVEFNPDPKSKWCGKGNPETNCQKVTWSVKAGFGKFIVKLYVGDPQGNTLVNFQINDQPFVDAVFIPKGELKIFEGTFESVNQLLILSANCENNCQYAMSKLNAMELYPYIPDSEKQGPIEEPSPEQLDPCKTASIGGRCQIGPDVKHCIFDDPSMPTALYCVGNLVMIPVPNTYRCLSQAGKFKCVQKEYANQSECIAYCPGKCDTGKCIG